MALGKQRSPILKTKRRNDGCHTVIYLCSGMAEHVIYEGHDKDFCIKNGTNCYGIQLVCRIL